MSDEEFEGPKEGVRSGEAVGFPRAVWGLRVRRKLWKETGAIHPAGVRNLQSQPLGRAGAPLLPPYHPAPGLRRRRRQKQLLLGSRSGSRSAETAGGEVSSALTPTPPSPGFRGAPPQPASPARPRPASDGAAAPEPWCALGFGR